MYAFLYVVMVLQYLCCIAIGYQFICVVDSIRVLQVSEMWKTSDEKSIIGMLVFLCVLIT